MIIAREVAQCGKIELLETRPVDGRRRRFRSAAERRGGRGAQAPDRGGPVERAGHAERAASRADQMSMP